MTWRSDAPSVRVHPARSTGAEVVLCTSNHSPSLSPTAAGLRITSLITTAGGASGRAHVLPPSGLPKSPSPKRVVDSHQFAPSELSAPGTFKLIEWPDGIGKPAVALHSTRSTMAPVLDFRTRRPLELYSGTPVPYT